MRCQVCGYEVVRPDATVCPKCGSALTRPAEQSWPVAPVPNQPPSLPPSAVPYVNQLGTVATSSGAPSVMDPSPGGVPGGTPGIAPPSYGWPAPPSVPYGAPPTYPPPGYTLPPGAPYSAPPTYPLPVGAPPNMPYGAPYPGYPTGAPFPGYPSGMPPIPPPAPPKRHVGLIVTGSVIAVLIVLVAVAGGLYAFVPQIRAFVIGNPVATVTAVGPAAPTATATPGETVLYQNTFATTASDWSNDAHCFLGTGGYHVKDGYVCYAPVGQQSDVDVTVDTKQISGSNNQPYGIAVRMSDSTGARYEFDLDAIGHWVVFRCDGKTCDRLIDYSEAASIRGGLNTSNTLELKVKGTHFDFFANGTKIGQMDDATYASGLIGLSGTESGECVFTNLTIAEPK